MRVGPSSRGPVRIFPMARTFMSWQKRQTIWPVLCILAGLFVLVVMSPRSWERKVRRPVAVQRKPAVMVPRQPTAGDQGQPTVGDQKEPTVGAPGQPNGTGQPEGKGGQKIRRPVAGRSVIPLQAGSGPPEGSASKGAFDPTSPVSAPSASLRQNPPAASLGQNVPDSAGVQGQPSLSASPRSTAAQAGSAPSGSQTSPSSGQQAEKEPLSLLAMAPRMTPHSGGKGEEGKPAEGGPPAAGLAESKEPPMNSANLPGAINPLREPLVALAAEPLARAVSVGEPASGTGPGPAFGEAMGQGAGAALSSAGHALSSAGPVLSSVSPGPSSASPGPTSDRPSETGLSETRRFTGTSETKPSQGSFSPGLGKTWDGHTRAGETKFSEPGASANPSAGSSESGASHTGAVETGAAQTSISQTSLSQTRGSEPRGSEPASEAVAESRASEAQPAKEAEPREPAWTPRALIAQLESIVEDPQAGPWARQVLLDLRAITPLLERRGPEAGMILHHLTQLGRESDALEPLIADRRTFRTFREIRFGLYRRLDLWSHWLQEPPPKEDLGGLRDLSEADWRQLSEAVEELDRLTANSPEGRGWRRYLLLDRLRELVARRQELSPAERRGLARAILERFSRRGLAPEQQRFLNTGPAGTVQRHLRLWAAEPAPETLEVLAHVEAYEATAQPSDAQRLAGDCQRLLFSAHPARRALGEKLRYHYQNPNLRIVVTEDLLNRLIPPRDPEYQWVSDTVLGVPVRGRSLIFTDVAVRTIPDPSRIRLALEVTGRVSSMTTAFQGPAIFYNRSDAVYVARKPLEVGTFGIRLWPAEVEVRNSTRLRGLETDFDPIPLLGSIVQEVARSQHEARRWEADREVEAKLRARAKAQIDAEADARLTSVSRNLQEQILDPMASLGLGPEMVEAKTDSERITMRLRIGGADHLGAHTPRPWAPSDSLASFQVHESAINNFLDRLDLAGRTFTLPQLRQWVAERLHRPEFAQRQTDHDDLEVTFAEQDPVVVRFQNGRFSVRLSIVYLRKGQNEWANFQVCAFYRPEIDGADARLVRDGVVQLRGELDMRSQIGLRGLFGKAFDKEKPLPISPEHISPDPRMRELMITQFVIEDGWAGVAIGPKQRPVPPEVARLPKVPASLGPIY